MPASASFINGLLDVIDTHISAFGGNDAAKISMVKDICTIPPGNQSVAKTQQRIARAALDRWPS